MQVDESQQHTAHVGSGALIFLKIAAPVCSEMGAHGADAGVPTQSVLFDRRTKPTTSSQKVETIMFLSPWFRSRKSTLGPSSGYARRKGDRRRHSLPTAALIEILETRQLLSASVLPLTIAGNSGTISTVNPAMAKASEPAPGSTTSTSSSAPIQPSLAPLIGPASPVPGGVTVLEYGAKRMVSIVRRLAAAAKPSRLSKTTTFLNRFFSMSSINLMQGSYLQRSSPLLTDPK